MLRLAKPTIPEKAIEKVVEVLESGDLVQGRYVEAFETSLQEYLGVKHAIVVSSGTAALHLALLASGIGEGDEVIVPALTFPATANVVELIGARPILVDINLDDFCVDSAKIEETITNRTRAILPVHEFGQAAEMNKIVEIAHQYDLDVIEDAACALGTEFSQQKVGTFGSMGCFSFHPRKAITTGEGGVVVTNSDRLAEKIRAGRNHGFSFLNGEFVFNHVGLNYRMTDFQAVLGLYQLGRIDGINRTRMRQARDYDENLANVDWLKTPTRFENRKAVYQTYHLLLDKKIDRTQLMNYLKKHDIETNLGAHALSSLPYYKKKYEFNSTDFSNAITAYKQGLALPIGDHLSNDDFMRVVQKLKKYESNG